MRFPYHFGACRKDRTKTALVTTVAAVGCGPIRLALLGSIISASIVSTNLKQCFILSVTNDINSVRKQDVLFFFYAIFFWKVRCDDDCDCQFAEPQACGRPEQPPNSTMAVTSLTNAESGNNYGVGASVEYTCNPGSLLIGPSSRTCLETGFYNEFPPVCKSKKLYLKNIKIILREQFNFI